MITTAYRSLCCLFLCLALACNTPRVAPQMEQGVITENRQLDTMTVTAPAAEFPGQDELVEELYELEPYNPAHTQENDLLHTRLDVRFDWAKEQVIGQATLRFKPYFYPTDQLTLDAKGFTWQQVSMGDKKTALEYEYDGEQIVIELPRTYTREQEYEVYLSYIATPSQSGGSAAITSDKGLFFINPTGAEDKPQQIWTQGETEHNSRWFPTIDKPNERTTQDISVTVAAKYETLSNGTRVSSVKNNDGTRTDRWVMDQPHAPYLFMLTVGEFAVVEDDDWNGKPVNYYVEKEYEAYAKDIFPYTPEMLTFFSNITGVPYPWPKYSQVAVRDYVSGAMENTTAVIFGEFMQGNDRELEDVDINEKIVAHEMFHHWFGDLVTCESWANLTLNEGFANYSEYLWLEHKHGRDAADHHLLQEWSGYLNSAQRGIHPLIHFGYADKEDMFDAHSYNKGGAVLHMLRAYVGDDAFFAALQKYLTDNAYSAVEVDELRLAFEDITGQDLNWFFDQWFLAAGHPKLTVEYGYTDGNATVTVTQTQDAAESPAIFQLPTAIAIYLDESSDPIRHQVVVDQREQTFTFPVTAEPKLVIFDADRVLLAERDETKSSEELNFQFMHAPRFLDRYEALIKLASDVEGLPDAILHAALRDPAYAIRELALKQMPEDVDPSTLSIVRQLAKEDDHKDVQATALDMLAAAEDEEVVAIARAVINDQSPYDVVAAGLRAIAAIDPAAGLLAVDNLDEATKEKMPIAVSSIYAATGDSKYLSYFEDQLADYDGPAAVAFLEQYQILAGGLSLEESQGIGAKLEAIATDEETSLWRRFAATQAIFLYIQGLQEQRDTVGDETALAQRIDELKMLLERVKAEESDPRLKGVYQRLVVD